MTAAVVYETSFGNTRRVAETIARELGATAYAVDAAPALDGIDLLVVGAPTHVHGLSTARSRQAAHDQGAPGEEAGAGARGLLETLPRGSGLRAAAFDTRVDKPRVLTGSAAAGIVKRLRRHGCTVVAEPESFFVESTEGPLAAGELERAAAWAQRLADTR